MKRFLSMDMPEYPEGFGEIRGAEEGAHLSSIEVIRADYQTIKPAILKHGAVLYARPEVLPDGIVSDSNTRLNKGNEVNNSVKGAVLHEGMYGHHTTRGPSFIAAERVNVATVCTDMAAAVRSTVCELMNNHPFLQVQHSLPYRREYKFLQDILRMIREDLDSQERSNQARALSDVREVLTALEDPKFRYTVSRRELMNFAVNVQFGIKEAMIPICWSTYWVCHLHDDVVHGRDVRTTRYREQDSALKFVAQQY